MRKLADQDLRIAPDLKLPGAEILEAASRSSGPGGQHVNKSNTRVTLRWNVRHSRVLTTAQRAMLLERLRMRLTLEGDLVVHADRSRSRGRNREQARERIAALVRDALVERVARHPTNPSRASKLRIRKQKTIRGRVKRHRGRVPHDDG